MTSAWLCVAVAGVFGGVAFDGVVLDDPAACSVPELLHALPVRSATAAIAPTNRCLVRFIAVLS